MKKVLLTLIVSLAFCGSIFAQQYESHYPPVNPHDFEQHGDIFAAVAIDNNMILPTDNYEAYEVAFYVGDECRGKDFLDYTAGDEYPMTNFTPIRYNPDIASNEEVSCRMYDHINEIEYTFFTSSEPILTGHDYSDWTNPVFIYFSSSFVKEIDPYTEDGGYYLIASPLNEAVNASDVIGLRTPNFDFYSFDQTQEMEWINHRDEENYQLQPGVGYLYANSTGEDLIFVGAPYTGDGEVTLDFNANAEFPGWNLVGNPFAQPAYINRAFYTMNTDGSEVMVGEGNEIGAMEGIFVVAQSQGETMVFTPVPANKCGQIVLNVTQDRGYAIDRAIVRFGQGDVLPKFMLNENNTKVSITKDGNDFAMVRSNKNGKLPVNFKPAQDGTYTISVNAQELEVRYLHLIDRMENIEVDLLQTPSYRFEAKVNEKPNRFELVFRTGSGLFKELFTKDGNDSFSFFTNGEWIINNEGDAVLQVVDINGQILSSEEISGCVSKHIEAAPGVYMLRLINGKDMKVQKVVVK